MNSLHSVESGEPQGISVRWWIVLGAIHLTACIAMWAIPRLGLLPGLTTPSGFWTFAVDASDFHIEATKLANLFRDGGWSGWWSIDAEAHTRFVSLFYLVFGTSTLSALPFITGTYLLVVFTVSTLATLLFDRRAGLVAATVVAVWPSFFIHSTQLLKDPLFILGQLAFITGMVLLLMRGEADWRRCAAVAVWSVAGFYVAYSVRNYTAELNTVMWLLALALLAVGAVQDRRVPWRKAATALVVLLVLGQSVVSAARGSTGGLTPVAPFASAALLLRDDDRAIWSIEQLANPEAVAAAAAARAAKAAAASGGLPVPGEAANSLAPAVPSASEIKSVSRAGAPITIAQKLEYWLLLVVDKRNDFSRFHIVGGSNIDRDVTFVTGADVIRYLPRAMLVGVAAPFPTTWFSDVSVIRLLAALETMLMYLFLPFALVSVWHRRREVAVWLAVLVAAGGMTMLGLIVPNVGIIFRLRYSFWFVMIVLAAPALWRLGARNSDAHAAGVA